MAVCAPSGKLNFNRTSEVEEAICTEAELRRKLMGVVNIGHQEAVEGKSIDASKLTSEIRKCLEIAS